MALKHKIEIKHFGESFFFNAYIKVENLNINKPLKPEPLEPMELAESTGIPEPAELPENSAGIPEPTELPKNIAGIQEPIKLPKNSTCMVMFYKTPACEEQLKVYHYELDFDLSPEAKNPWEQAYSYLKSLPEFEGAKDV